VDMDLMMVVMAEGVKGLLRIRRLSLVVCALRRLEASWRRRRGSRGLEIEETGAPGEMRED